MSNVLVDEKTLTQIADAIREKHGTDGKYKPGEMPEAILEIETNDSDETDSSKPIRFYGAYGDLIYSYSLQEIAEMTELPPLPEYKGLVAQCWNWSMESIKTVTREAEIGSLYITDDGSTRIYVELVEGALSPKIGFIQERANAVWVDWGDGSAMESSETCGDETVVSIEHHYSSAGNYTIRLIPEDNTTFSFPGDSCSTKILHKTTEYSYGNRVYGNAIRKIELGKGITKLGGRCFNSSSLKSVTISKEIKDISNAFQECEMIKCITIPQGVSSLTTYGLRSCSSLEKILFPDSRLALVGSSVRECNSLKELIFPVNMNLRYSSIFSDCMNLRRVVFPRTMESMGGELFNNCHMLKEVILPDTIVNITSGIFQNCYELESVEIPESVVSISSSAFYSCKSLRKVKLPKAVTTLGGNAFSTCYSLAEITIPEGVTEIQSSAFNNCLGMEHYYMLPTTPPKLSNVNTFNGIPVDCKIHVPKGCLEAYQTAEYWSTYADYMVEMEDTKSENI